MNRKDFLKINIGDKIYNNKTKVGFEIQEIVSHNPIVIKIKNLKYIGQYDYINENTCKEYSLQ
jgi:hypothetical protein